MTKYAMQHALKTLMGQMNSRNNLFNNAALISWITFSIFISSSLRVFHLTLSSCFSTFCDSRCICKHQLHQPPATPATLATPATNVKNEKEVEKTEHCLIMIKQPGSMNRHHLISNVEALPDLEVSQNGAALLLNTRDYLFLKTVEVHMFLNFRRSLGILILELVM
ncbi:Tetratricopeptide repeat-like superfamily protein [Prunus dulcis]|uniref:Tetratricopeptide repeat-like superfamily protein n=1 Tax=Prunus dulcis TaxID=3755 RepID=A0A4Y1RG87_PRUDU|nr:Tetratricopeptide repeat-like superfamily protein [Prunus dulcis]